jgi:nicotinamidase/pyrazinamidase
VVNALIEEATEARALVVASRDWHAPGHSSFVSAGGPWPEHCVQATPGADFHEDLRLPKDAMIVSKGERAEADQYSALAGTGLADELRRRRIRRVMITGLAQDVCVRATALDAVRAGFETHVFLPGTRPITPEGGRQAITDMIAAGVFVDEERSLSGPREPEPTAGGNMSMASGI